MTKVLLWGIGGCYNKYFNLINFYSQTNFDVIGITDNNPPNCSKIDNFEILPKCAIEELEFDCIIVLTEKYYHEVRLDAISNYNVPSDIIFPGRVLLIPYFDIKQLLEISKSHWSIVSNNCWGGMLYYSLGIECRTPFKNLSINDNDYLKLISEFDDYMNIEPVWEGEFSLDKNKGEEVPLLKLKDIKIKCNHYNDPNIAIMKWMERREKINRRNLIFEMYTESKEVEKEFNLLELNGKQICFVPFETSNCKSVYLPKQSGQNKFYETVNESAKVDGKGYLYNLFSIFIDYKGVALRQR